MKYTAKAVFISLCYLTASSASAGIVTFFGIDENPGEAIPPGGNALSARNDFLSNLTGGVGTENFEGVEGSSPFSLSFPGSSGSITADLTGTDLSLLTASSSGTYATSGSNFLRAITSSASVDFTIDFSSGISAFGFYGTDIGDSGGGDVVMTLSNGTTETLTIPTSDLPNGNLLFYGFISDTSSFTKIEFQNTAGAGDYWGFDDMTIGDIGQVQEDFVGTVTPEPASMALWGLGTLGMGVIARRRQRKQTAA